MILQKVRRRVVGNVLFNISYGSQKQPDIFDESL